MDKENNNVELKSIKLNAEQLKPPQYNNIENSHDKHYARMESSSSSLGPVEEHHISIIQINDNTATKSNGSALAINGSTPSINFSTPSVNGSAMELVSREKQMHDNKPKEQKKSMPVYCYNITEQILIPILRYHGNYRKVLQCPGPIIFLHD